MVGIQVPDQVGTYFKSMPFLQILSSSYTKTKEKIQDSLKYTIIDKNKRYITQVYVNPSTATPVYAYCFGQILFSPEPLELCALGLNALNF